MRNLKVTKTAVRYARSCYKVKLHILHVATSLGLRHDYLGEVAKVGSTWSISVHTHFVSGREAHLRMGGFRTMRDAIEALRAQAEVLISEHFAHQVNVAYDEAHEIQETIAFAEKLAAAPRMSLAQAEALYSEVKVAEIEAHTIQAIIASAQARADHDAKPMLEATDSPVAMVAPLNVVHLLNGTNEQLACDLRALHRYLRDSATLDLMTVSEYAYADRMIEHELIRRANVEESHAADEFGGDFDGYADAMYRRETGEL